ncbi:imidazoleglycerol-phosphate dehydratase HisB [Nitratiruptor sp. SB155-2]|uniref:Imidazoleglycerol-phosphate dehydratase n=1 Tax=Nitratiruptor sp. (strain SB155-2) TaxID=387092 RepID=HIS7_NITSB|nr:imidazoleglycerol-phosphate dehydratase HisB [Nitratiruptor sp. SB155-2]A6Q330.1 RecName: Full=Imidazoleglycerol-phosphate dehydratase; Short=IGPD [Nitratiruptor sp. SB155-2]BAF69889.1 imidazoleglycerol-phosphate dehydratase [Nitratiruptor sp. SB155-2]
MIKIERQTKETDIVVELNVDGKGKSDIDTGIGFFDHMLESFAKHARFDVKVVCKGDIHVDFHHSVEDVGIVLGQAFYQSVFPVHNKERFGDAVIVMDESAVECAIDLSNRPFLVYEVDIDGTIGQFDAELIEEFFRAFVFNARITAHIIQKRGKNRHHLAEASFKALAVALRRALAEDKRAGMPSTKGVL